jgi:hypothetical protein
VIETVAVETDYMNIEVDDAVDEIHLCNYAAEQIPAKYTASYSYEDGNVYEFEETKSLWRVIATLAPGKFVLITTGDYIATAEAPFEQTTYDPNYYFYIVPATVWNEHKGRIQELDREWRDAATRRLTDGNVQLPGFGEHGVIAGGVCYGSMDKPPF